MRGRFDAESDIGHIAGDVGGDGGMGEFRRLETVDTGGIDPVLREQGFEHLPCG